MASLAKSTLNCTNSITISDVKIHRGVTRLMTCTRHQVKSVVMSLLRGCDSNKPMS